MIHMRHFIIPAVKNSRLVSRLYIYTKERKILKERSVSFTFVARSKLVAYIIKWTFNILLKMEVRTIIHRSTINKTYS